MNMFAVLIAQCQTVFWGKNPGENAENTPLKTYCSPISNMTTGFPQAPCSC